MNPENDEITPDELAELVYELPNANKYELSDYARSIRMLHDEKGYSFRKIVEFLKENGVVTNRSAVYDVYREGLLPDDEVPEEPLVDPDTGQIVEQ